METRVRYLGREEPLEVEAWQPTPVILVWRIPWTEEPGGLGPLGRKESDTSELSEHMGRGYSPGVSHITSFTSDENVTRGLASE